MDNFQSNKPTSMFCITIYEILYKQTNKLAQQIKIAYNDNYQELVL